MARLFPFRPESPDVSQEPRLVNLDDTGADEVFAALSSDTARTILARLYDDPGTATDVAEAADTSLQNARYHLDKLRDAGLIEEVDTWYSSRGTEMTVYAPTNEPLVVAAGREESTGMLRDALKRVLGAVGILGFASLLVDRLARNAMLGADGGITFTSGNGDDAVTGDRAGDGNGGNGAGGGDAGDGSYDGSDEEQFDLDQVETEGDEIAAGNGDGAGTPTSNVSETPTDDPITQTVEATREVANATPTESPTPTVAMPDGGVVDAATTLPPGLLFFAGGLLAIALVVGWWYASRYRPAIE